MDILWWFVTVVVGITVVGWAMETILNFLLPGDEEWL